MEYLPSGEATLTRRAIKHSRIHAKVVRWSGTRKRYERHGIVVEPTAIERAIMLFLRRELGEIKDELKSAG